MILLLAPVLVFWSLNSLCQAASPDDPWSSCPADKLCRSKFGNGVCDNECSGSQCLRDGFDCLNNKETCNTGYIQYCRDHYDNSHCEQGCNNAPCGWDGSDCSRDHHPNWAKGALIVQTAIPFQSSPFQNSSLLWALSVLIQRSVKLRGVVPFQPSVNLNSLDTQKLVDLHRQAPNYKSNGSLLFLQVDNRPCRKLPFSCFPYASEMADFLNALLELNRTPAHIRAEIQTLIQIRGISKELTVTESTTEEPEGSPAWLWPVVGISVGIGLTLTLVALLVLVWFRRRRHRREGGERVHHRSTATENDEGKTWMHHTSERKEARGRTAREKERNGEKKKKKKKEKELGKKRREPLGEDAMRMRPLKKTLDIGSDTDMTQSSMEDISKTICDHRSPAQKHFNINHQQLAVPTPPRRWDRNPIPTHQRPPSNSAPVQWCGPDGSVVLIRAVRSGLDRVVVELLRAGVPVNNTDHTGRSALHWACSVNHLSLARTLIRYGAAVDMQDHKGETALFLSALHGCYETARLLLLNSANQELTDRRGRLPIDVAQDGGHHQVVEILLAHRVQRSPFPMAHTTEVLWDDRGYLYSPWVASPPCLPGRSASFSGIVGHREITSQQPSDWQSPPPQNWQPMLNQSTTALVSPRILSRPSRPISTLQEVTSEAEDDEREAALEVLRSTTPHFSSPQPAPRQRSFSCTQPALQRRYSSNLPDPPPSNALPERLTNEQVEIVVMPHPKASSDQSDGKSTDFERENKKSCEAKIPSKTASNEPRSIQTVM